MRASIIALLILHLRPTDVNFASQPGRYRCGSNSALTNCRTRLGGPQDPVWTLTRRRIFPLAPVEPRLIYLVCSLSTIPIRHCMVLISDLNLICFLLVHYKESFHINKKFAYEIIFIIWRKIHLLIIQTNLSVCLNAPRQRLGVLHCQINY